MGIFLLRYRKWLMLLLIAGASAGGYSAYAASRSAGDAAPTDASLQMKQLLGAREATTAPAGAKPTGTPSPKTAVPPKTAAPQADKGDVAGFAEPANAPTEEPVITGSTIAPKRPKAAPTPKSGKSQSQKTPQPSAKPAAKASAKINLNTAGLETLLDLPGIGESKAKAIVAYREQNGAFRSVDELLKVKGIGPKLLENIRSRVTV